MPEPQQPASWGEPDAGLRLGLVTEQPFLDRRERTVLLVIENVSGEPLSFFSNGARVVVTECRHGGGCRSWERHVEPPRRARGALKPGRRFYYGIAIGEDRETVLDSPCEDLVATLELRAFPDDLGHRVWQGALRSGTLRRCGARPAKCRHSPPRCG